MIEEKFAHGTSFLHQRDPRCKIVAATLFAITVALLNSFPALYFGLAISVLLVITAQLPFKDVVLRLLFINGFTLFLWITLPLTYGGEEIFHLGNLRLSQQGALLAAMITLKTNIIVASIIALLATSTIAELGHSLEKLHFPRKLCFILLYTYRYVFVIYQEYMRLLRAAKLRSFTPGTNLHTYKTYAYLFGMTLVNSYNRSNRIHQAMLLRGFNGRLVSLQRYHCNPADLFFLSLIIGATTAVVITNFIL